MSQVVSQRDGLAESAREWPQTVRARTDAIPHRCDSAQQMQFRTDAIPHRCEPAQMQFHTDAIPHRCNSAQMQFRTDAIPHKSAADKRKRAELVLVSFV